MPGWMGCTLAAWPLPPETLFIDDWDLPPRCDLGLDQRLVSAYDALVTLSASTCHGCLPCKKKKAIKRISTSSITFLECLSLIYIRVRLGETEAQIIPHLYRRSRKEVL